MSDNNFAWIPGERDWEGVSGKPRKAQAEIDRLRAALAEAESDRECLKDGNRKLREEFDKTLVRLAEAERERDALRINLESILLREDRNTGEWKTLWDRAERAEADLAAAREVIAPFSKSVIDISLGDIRRARAFLERTATADARDRASPGAEVLSPGEGEAHQPRKASPSPETKMAPKGQ